MGSALGPASGALMVSKARTPRIQMSGIPRNFLSECSARYWIALALPWSDQAREACIPDGNSRASRKITTFQRVTATVGTAQVGFICTCPTIASDMPCIFYTTSAFAGTTCAPFVVSSTTGALTLATGWAYAVLGNLPYTANQFIPVTTTQTVTTTFVAGRIVSHAISAEYTGTIMNCGGLTECYNSADHSNLYNYTIGGTSVGSLGVFTELDIARVQPDRKCWCTADFGRTSLETAYTSFAGIVDQASQAQGPSPYTQQMYPFSNGLPAIGCAYNSGFGTGASTYAPGFGSITNVIALTGTAGNTFNCEVVQHCEFVGQLAQSDLTPSTRDPVGFAHVQDAAARAPAIRASKRVSWAEAMLTGLKDVAAEYGPSMLKAGAKMLAGAMMA